MYGPVVLAPRKQRQSSFVIRVALPALAILVALAALLITVVTLSADQANQLAGKRQRALADTVIKGSIAQVPHDQEGATIWEEAVREVRKPRLNLKWLDGNLGIWFHSYYGHDEVFVVDPHGNAIYAMDEGKRADASLYNREARIAAAPLIAELRRKLAQPSPSDTSASARTPGSVDLALIDGHPSIVSAKPIVSDTGSPEQAPGEEFIHISVRHLDGRFADMLARQYQLDGARFSRSGATVPPERALPLRSSARTTIGYLIWKPFGPGALMVQRILPAAAAAMLLILATVTWLLHRIHRSALQLQASQAQAVYLAFHDPLTGLANRGLFDERLARTLAESRGTGKSVALHYFDLDRFKNVNDTLGHPAGDELICAMSRRLVEATRETDIVARIGGDEFAIIQTGVNSPGEAEVLCMRIVEAVNEAFELSGTRVNISVSIGVALAPADACEATELARKADIALYEAKAAGRGRYVFFAEAMDATVQQRRGIELGLRRALTTCNEFEVVYQPLFSAQSRKITGAEALVRWHHPDHGVLSPAMFIPVAEATGLIEPLGEWVLEQACAAARDWPIQAVSVNVSAIQLRNEGFAERVLAILARTGLDPERLELEITETSFIESAANCQPNLAALRARGVQIALDDFGTGYSSFSHLREFDVDRIKIDQSFVNGIDMREGGSPIIQAIVDLAKASGMKVTAEGVETVEQSVFLTRAGCNSLQGFLLSCPVSRNELNTVFAGGLKNVTRSRAKIDSGAAALLLPHARVP
ncbi:EAL domain-containing protein [soil metagenome]